MPKVRFEDYDGPTGLYIATGKEVLSLISEEGARALVESAMAAEYLITKEEPCV